MSDRRFQPRHRALLGALLTTLTLSLAGCASGPRLLMPTPLSFQQPAGREVFAAVPAERQRPDLDLLYITDRAPQPSGATASDKDPNAGLPYGQDRSKSIAFGAALIRIGPGLTWGELKRQSLTATRTREVSLTLGPVRELGRYPAEPYGLVADSGGVRQAPAAISAHQETEAVFREELQRRLAQAPSRQVMLYVHGFNETFESAAFTAAELCHFLGRVDVCAFYTWPASVSGNFLISYTNTTESAEYSVGHLKKAIRALAQTPGVDGLQLLAHSRGSALLLSALRELSIEAIANGRAPADTFKIENVILMSPDIDADIAGQQIQVFGSDPGLTTNWQSPYMPPLVRGWLNVYSSPEDRALLISKILFRSRNRVGGLSPKDVPPEAQAYFATWGQLSLVVYQGKRTDAFGHSYFTSNPQVSSDLIALVRDGAPPGSPDRPLVQTGPVSWTFPEATARR